VADGVFSAKAESDIDLALDPSNRHRLEVVPENARVNDVKPELVRFHDIKQNVDAVSGRNYHIELQSERQGLGNAQTRVVDYDDGLGGFGIGTIVQRNTGWDANPETGLQFKGFWGGKTILGAHPQH